MRFSKFFSQATKRVFTKELSDVVLTPETFTQPLELMEVPVEAGKEYEIHYEIRGGPAPDAGITNPVLRLHGGVSVWSPAFNVASDSADLVTNGTTEDEPWGLGDIQRVLITEDGVLRLSMWVKDSTDADSPPPNLLEIDKGVIILREM